MNEKSKLRMERQQQAIYDNLTQTFNLPVFEDELGEDELPDTFNYFYIIYGDFRSTEATGVLLQEIYVVYVTEDNPDVETTTLDVITMVSKVNGVVFERTAKERYQKNDSDEYVDQVNVIFSRKIAYEQD
jgi:hypothetical protein